MKKLTNLVLAAGCLVTFGCNQTSSPPANLPAGLTQARDLVFNVEGLT